MIISCDKCHRSTKEVGYLVKRKVSSQAIRNKYFAGLRRFHFYLCKVCKLTLKSEIENMKIFVEIPKRIAFQRIQIEQLEMPDREESQDCRYYNGKKQPPGLPNQQ